MSDNWDDIARWWADAVRDDPAQSKEPLEILGDLIEGAHGPTIDLGCGEGQAMRLVATSVGGSVIGTDLSRDLLVMAQPAGPVVQAQLPQLSWARKSSFGLAISVGLLDLIPDQHEFFASVAEVVRHGGHLIVVINHPVSTSPQSEPLCDPEGEILWRWGEYLSSGTWTQPADGRMVDLFHRPLAELLTAAAQAGWALERMIERGPSEATIERFPQYRGQANIPTLLGVRWNLRL